MFHFITFNCSTVGEKLFQLPEKTVASRLVRPLLSRFVLMDATACEFVAPHVLTPCRGKPNPDSLCPISSHPYFANSEKTSI
jgi:SCY1-like protein 3